MKGHVIRLVHEKGFGFIRGKDRDETHKDFFFHKSQFNGHWDDLVMDFNNNIRIEVEFEGKETSKGLRAEKVERKDWPNS